MALRYLFIDFDSFFASVEQQLQPQLRGRPVGVVPSLGVETTCCIAASYEAKAYGVKTGTPVREARHLCPGIVFVEANHPAYVRMHSRIKALIHKIIYVDAVLSIDEMYGRLPPHEQAPDLACAKAESIKAALAREIGPHVRASIGLAPNRFLAKLASKMEKPDGLTRLDFEDLPHKITPLELDDLNGIGSGMLRRLRAARIYTGRATLQGEPPKTPLGLGFGRRRPHVVGAPWNRPAAGGNKPPHCRSFSRSTSAPPQCLRRPCHPPPHAPKSGPSPAGDGSFYRATGPAGEIRF
jgi:DNA polymerase-4